MIGQTLGHFQVLEKLGEGGMGVVYKAHDTHLDRLVAIKVLSAERAADLDRRRLVQEAKTASSLRSPRHDRTLYEFATETGPASYFGYVRIRAERQALVAGGDDTDMPGAALRSTQFDQEARSVVAYWESGPTGSVFPSPSVP